MGHSLVVLAALQLAPAPPPVPEPQRSAWPKATMVFAMGALFAPEELGRDVNRTGGEELIAFLGDGIYWTVQAGVETGLVGGEFALGFLAWPIEVVNEFGTGFPYHGKFPWLYSMSARAFPLAVVPGLAERSPVQAWVALGGGGMIMSVDLDNVEDQTLYHSWQWSLGGGVRLPLSDGSDGGSQIVLELRLSRFRVAANGPLRGFDALGLTVGLGGRF